MRPIRWAPAWAFLALLAVAGTLLTLAVHARSDVDSFEDRARQQEAAIESAREVTEVLLNLRGERAETELARLAGMATGDFATQLDTLDTTVSALLRQGRVSSRGSVLAAGIDETDAEHTTVLVAARTLVRNSEIPRGEVRDFRIEVEVTREGATWKVADVEFLP